MIVAKFEIEINFDALIDLIQIGQMQLLCLPKSRNWLHRALGKI